jgi:hypothetical protein
MSELSGHQPDKSHCSWEDIARNAAAELKMPPLKIPHIEARGLLCHELMHLLGGRIEFVETPWKSFVLRALESFIPIAAVCRWIPPSKSELAEVGYDGGQETKVYRFMPESDAPVIFFVNFKPEPPAGGRYIRSLFNVPQLDLHRFLRPPFNENRGSQLDQRLRSGMTERFTPMPMTEAAADYLSEQDVEICRGLWEELSTK